ncbi:hypothetical protein HanIR_Chr17g0846821 [Helianthus annuus]|nr:hypothetical protein HanIR_Chr17g0846821 [Helianthus annuus]
MSGQIKWKTSSSECLSLALAAVIPSVILAYKKLRSGVGDTDKYSRIKVSRLLWSGLFGIFEIVVFDFISNNMLIYFIQQLKLLFVFGALNNVVRC